MSGAHKSAQQQCYEYLLFGSVSEKGLHALLHRLRGLCDFATTGGVPFVDRELAFRIDAGSVSSRVRVRQSLDTPEAPLHLIYTGQLELGDAHRPTAVRTYVQSTCTHNLPDLLKDLGFTLTSELILRGFLFKKGHIRVTVFRLHQSSDSSDPDAAPAFSDHYLVELSALMASGQDTIGTEMRAFAEHLKPIVTMEKTDGLR